MSRYLLIIFLGITLLGCSRRDPKKLVVGMEMKFPPFEMVDQQGTPQGISVEMAYALGKYLSKEVELQNIRFEGLIPSLKTGKIDLIISSMTRTEERAQSIDFSDPYVHTGIALLVEKNAPIHSIADVDKPKIIVAIKKGTTSHLYATNRLKQAQILVLEDEAACLLEVLNQRAQVFMYDQISILQHWQRHSDRTRAILEPFQKESWAIGLRKGNETLKKQVNQFLADYRAQGGFEKLAQQYLRSQKEAFEKLGVPFFFQ